MKMNTTQSEQNVNSNRQDVCTLPESGLSISSCLTKDEQHLTQEAASIRKDHTIRRAEPEYTIQIFLHVH